MRKERAAWIRCSFSGSMLAVASSRMMMGASVRITRAMEISPSVTSQNRVISLAAVDFPPPDGPTSDDVRCCLTGVG